MNTPNQKSASKITAITYKSMPLLFVLMWSSGSIFIKLGLNYTNPFTFVFWRLVLVVLFMLLLSLATKAPWPNSWKQVRKIAGAGLLLQFAYLITCFSAIYYGVSPAVLAIILGLQPLLTAIIYNFILSDKISIFHWLGIIIGLLGVILVVIDKLSSHAATVTGVIFALVCVCTITIGSIIQKYIPEMDLRTGSVIQCGVSLIPTAIITALLGTFTLPLAPAFLISLSWMVFVVSIGAICLYYTLLKKRHAIAVSSLLYLVPPVTALLSHFAFNETFNNVMLFGMFLIVFGVYITTK